MESDLYHQADDTDPYLQDNGTLRNKLGIADRKELLRAEADISYAKSILLEDEKSKGSFDFDYLKSIHNYIFDDIYDWAGQPRTINMTKSSDVMIEFTPYTEIESQAKHIFEDLALNNNLRGLDREAFASQAADLFARINSLHPFREGNGRVQRAFIQALAREAGHDLDFSVISKERMAEASIEACQGRPEMMRWMFADMIDPVRAWALSEAVQFFDSSKDGKDNWDDLHIATTAAGQEYFGDLVAQRGDICILRYWQRVFVGWNIDLPRDAMCGKWVEFVASDQGLDRARTAKADLTVGPDAQALTDRSELSRAEPGMLFRPVQAVDFAETIEDAARREACSYGPAQAALAELRRLAPSIWHEPDAAVKWIEARVFADSWRPVLDKQFEQNPAAAGELLGGAGFWDRLNGQRNLRTQALEVLHSARVHIRDAVSGYENGFRISRDRETARREMMGQAVPMWSKALAAELPVLADLRRTDAKAYEVRVMALRPDMVDEMKKITTDLSNRFGSFAFDRLADPAKAAERVLPGEREGFEKLWETLKTLVDAKTTHGTQEILARRQAREEEQARERQSGPRLGL